MPKSLRLFGLCLVIAFAGLVSCNGGSDEAVDEPAGPVVDDPDPSPPASQRPTFNRTRAFADLEAQCDFGARVPGSQAHANCLQWLAAQLQQTAETIITQEFSAETPFGGPYDFTNIIAYYPGDDSQPVLLGAHWDCRPEADQDPDPALRTEPVMGANDGASGVAVLLELARNIHDNQNRPPVLIALFDAEDSGSYQNTSFPLNGWALGSQYLVQNWPEELPEPAEAIVVDLVGQDTEHNERLGTPGGSNDYPDFQIERHSLDSAPLLVDALWTIAENAGHDAFKRTTRGPVTDDHLPFIQAGYPAVDIIDLPVPEWHTADDTPEHCSPDPLFQVGDTLLRYLYNDD